MMLALEIMLGLFSASFFVGGVYFWADARRQRYRALNEMRVARRLRRHTDEAWERYKTASEEMVRVYGEMADAWNRIYGTPFPVRKPRVPDNRAN